jgi:hypothetical protein
VELAALPRGHAPHHVRPVLDGLAPAGLEKTRAFLKTTQPSGFFWFFGVFWVFWFFLVFYKFAQKRVFRVFSVSRII